MPETPIADIVETVHGQEVHDPYRWLEDGDDPAVREWVAAQNRLTRSVLDALPPRAGVAARIREAMDVGALGGTHPRGRYRFGVRRSAGMDQPVLLESRAGGEEGVLLEPGA